MAQVALIWMILMLQTMPVDQIANQASDAFLRGDFLAAADLFQSAADAAPEQGALAYNAALAAYELGDRGRAVLYALRAQDLMPGDSDLRALISLLRVDSAESPSTFEERVFTLIEEQQAAIMIAALVAWYLGFSIMAWAVWRRAAALKYGGLLLLAIALLLAASLALLHIRDSAHPRAVIVRSEQSMSGPGADYLALTEFRVGTEIRIRDEEAGWLRVVSRSGRHGWLPRDAAAYVRAD